MDPELLYPRIFLERGYGESSSRRQRLMGSLKGLFHKATSSKQPARLSLGEAMEIVTRDISDIFRNLPNFRSFSFRHRSRFPSFFGCPTLCSGLQKLSIDVSEVRSLDLWMNHGDGVVFEDLREFSVILASNPLMFGWESEDARSEYLLGLASFVNKHRRLRAFSFTALCVIDTSRFFASLDTMPLLDKLNLRVGFELESLHHWSSFNGFFRAHNHFTRLILRNEDMSSDPSMSLPRHVLEGVHLPQLRVLDLDLATNYFPGDCISLIATLGALELQSLKLGNRLLVMEELRQLRAMAEVFPSGPPLRNLHLYMRKVDKEALDIIAETFPQLHSLTLLTMEPHSSLEHKPDALHRQLEASGTDYSWWKLLDLAVLMPSRGDEADHDVAMQRLLARAIPSIQNFDDNRYLFI
ncbi:hypothetical protein HGRIS_002079 [Hohenbuehelia grisea]